MLVYDLLERLKKSPKDIEIEWRCIKGTCEVTKLNVFSIRVRRTNLSTGHQVLEITLF